MDELKPKAPVALSNAGLAQLPAEVARPLYDRGALTPGIVHIGLGNFHRAHQAWYLHRLMQMGAAQDWAIIGAGMRPYDSAMRDKLMAQDCLSTLIELAPEGRSAEIIGPMIDYVPITEHNRALIDAMADPAIRIVSLTVTEGGYYLDAVTGRPDTAHPDIVHDAANPGTPRSAFGAMVEALRLRRAAGHAPFTALSCDNLTGNGTILEQSVIGLARLSDPSLADWIETQGAFPNSMVDCIVPATGPAELALAHSLGIDDAAPVSHENFRQWVLEDRFCAGRPDWDLVGATFTDDVHAFEAMKLRMLNAGHQVLANAGELLSLHTIDACMADPRVAAFFDKVERTEIMPHVAPVPDMTPEGYLALIKRRFANPEIRDTTRRVAFDGASRHTGFVLPVLRERLETGASIEGLALVEALWARMCAGTREDGTVIAPNDPIWDSLTEAAHMAKEDPAHWLAQSAIYGDLAHHQGFASTFEKWLEQIWRDGTEAALTAYTKRSA